MGANFVAYTDPSFVHKGPINNIPTLLNDLTPTRQQAIFWTNDGLGYRRICASLGLNELIHLFLDANRF